MDDVDLAVKGSEHEPDYPQQWPGMAARTGHVTALDFVPLAAELGGDIAQRWAPCVVEATGGVSPRRDRKPLP